MKPTGHDAQSWLAGQHPGGAAYAAGEHVIVRGRERPKSGTVLMLAELEPEPRYLIEIGRGHYVQARQSELSRSS
jgi:hypothetical protein